MLETHYDAELHQMTGYMRRLDGAYGKIRGGNPCMDPFAPDGAAKWDIDANETALFGFWFFEAWDNVFSAFFSSIWGSIMQVISEARLDALLGAEVMM